MAHAPTVNISAADTPLEAYRQPILKALADMGGKGPLLDLHPGVVEIMKDVLKPGDYDLDDGKVRYVRAILVQGSAMVAEGLLKQYLPFHWELTQEGRKLL